MLAEIFNLPCSMILLLNGQEGFNLLLFKIQRVITMLRMLCSYAGSKHTQKSFKKWTTHFKHVAKVEGGALMRKTNNGAWGKRKGVEGQNHRAHRLSCIL